MDESSTFFKGIAVKLNVREGNQETFDSLKESLQEIQGTAQSLQKALNDAINLQRESTMYNQETFDSFFLAMLSGNICEILQSYPQYLESRFASSFTVDICVNVGDTILTQGLTIAIENYVQIYQDLLEICEFDDLSEFKARFKTFQESNNIPDLIQQQVYLTQTIQALTDFLKAENTDQKSNLQQILLILLIYQFVVLAMIFYFAWIPFYRIMDNLMHRTKQYLVTLHVTDLVQNPFVQNYLHNTLR